MIKLLAAVFLIAAGQLLFKRTAQGLGGVEGAAAVLRHLIVDPWFIAAMVLYVTSTLLWISALREVPLSRAYIFMALAFVLVPAGAVIFYGETLGLRYLVGLALVCAGIVVVGKADTSQASTPTAELRQ